MGATQIAKQIGIGRLSAVTILEAGLLYTQP
ncbi:hypothetical protein GR268_43385 [Rhizobium leguminosarum]|nr:hypothetical protein [Rhizobium leguminosarum]